MKLPNSLPKAHSKWLHEKGLQSVFDAIEAAGGEVRVNGGAVRNSLMEMAVSDVDLSTTLEPAATMSALEAAGIKALPTGFDHGTITAVVESRGYEITSLREDVETDGRRAVVRYGTSWEADAMRRDLTMNALYCGRDGELFDPLGGLDDLLARNVRFIGEAEARIREDYLRILRFFRFFAWYGDGRPDAEGLKACARLKDGMDGVSAERIWVELFKTLSAPDPSRSLLWMRTTGVLSKVLPESEKWGIDLIPALISMEGKYRLKPDAMLRLEAMIRPDGEKVVKLSRRLKLSNAQAARLTGWAMEAEPDSGAGEAVFSQSLYSGDRMGIADRVKLALARAHDKDPSGKDAKALASLMRFERKWKRPVFPLKGQDLLDAGHKSGPSLGKSLRRLESDWVHSGFKLTKAELINRASQES